MYYTNNGNGFSLTNIQKFKYEGNKLETTFESGGKIFYFSELIYDDKKNPIRVSAFVPNFTENNILIASYWPADPDEKGGGSKYSYIYNSWGFPIESTERREKTIYVYEVKYD